MPSRKYSGKNIVISYWSDLGWWPIVLILIFIFVAGIYNQKFWPTFISAILIISLLQNISRILIYQDKVEKRSMFFTKYVMFAEFSCATIHYGHRSKPRIKLWYKDLNKSEVIYRPASIIDRRKLAVILDNNNIEIPIEVKSWI